MHKQSALTATIAVLLTGCQSTPNSWTWETVKAAPHIGPGIRNRSHVYADQLHKTLQQAGVEHKVVTFRFKYPSLLRIDRAGEDIAVIYRDSGTPTHPWWLMAECLWSPVWLPAGAVESHVAFYLRRPATIMSTTSFLPTMQKASKANMPEIKRNAPAEKSAVHPGKRKKSAGKTARETARKTASNDRGSETTRLPTVRTSAKKSTDNTCVSISEENIELAWR